jgi:deoxycytidylate deaminase
MTCAKKKVTCIIVSPIGKIFTGENSCRNPQTSCPRNPGEDYAKCITICEQEGHAEMVALQKAGHHAQGSIVYLIGHSHYCRNCQIDLFNAGVQYLTKPINI